jgi:uncharacterized membrane protein (DUF373 family)
LAERAEKARDQGNESSAGLGRRSEARLTGCRRCMQDEEHRPLSAACVCSWYGCISHHRREPGEVLPTLDRRSQMRQLMLRWRVAGREWETLTLYQRFESAVALTLTLVITLVILVALYRLTVEVVGGLLIGALNPLDHKVFQAVFGEIMTLLIALEFNHTLRYVVTRQQSIIQTKVVLLIALLALARKFMILDLKVTTPDQLLALAAVTIALGVTYWLMRERDDRLPPLHADARSDRPSQDA